MKDTLETELMKAIPKVEKLFSEQILYGFLNSDYEDLDIFNFGIGTFIRLKLLRKKSGLYKCFFNSGVSDKDKMTLIILQEYYKSKKLIKLSFPY